MDFWEILRANSSAPIGSDIWTLLNTQNTGAANCIAGEFVCVSAESRETQLIETDEGHTLLSQRHYTVIIDDVLAESIAVEAGKTKVLDTLVSQEISAAVPEGIILSETLITEIDNTLISQTNIKEQL